MSGVHKEGERPFELSRLRFTTGDLKKLDRQERVYLVFAGHLLNEINALNKLIIYSIGPYKEAANEDAATVWSLMLIRLLSGKLHEGWRMISRRYFRSNVAQIQAKRKNVRLSAARDWLEGYFDNEENLIGRVRDHFAFHYSKESAQEMGRHLDSVDDDHPLEMLLTNAHGNSWYVGSEDVALHAMARDLGTGTIKQTLDALVADITEVTGKFQKFVGETMECAFVHLKDLGVEITENREQLHNVPDDGEFQLQFFTRLESVDEKTPDPGGQDR